MVFPPRERTSRLKKLHFAPLCALFLIVSPLSARTIGEVVEDHVEKGLEGKKDEPPPPKPDEPTEEPPPADEPSSEDAAKDPKAKARRPKKKKRGSPLIRSSTVRGKDKSKGKQEDEEPGPKDEAPPAPAPESTSERKTTSPPKPQAESPARVTAKTTSARTTTTRSSRPISRNQTVRLQGKPYNFLALPRKPPRVIGENFEIDPQVGFGLRGWYPDQYPALKINTQQYPQWYVGINGRFFKRVRIYRAFYQSVGLKSPRNTGAVIATKAAKAAPGAATKAMGMMGYNIKFSLVPMIRYEARSYEATAKPQRPIQVIPFSAKKDDDLDDTKKFPFTEADLYAVSTFETFIVGMHYNDRLKDENGDFIAPQFLPFYFGAGFTQYRKPYQVRVGDLVLDDLVFNGHFRGAGLALGFDIDGGIDKVGINFGGQVGLGQIRLLEDLTLNEVLPDDWFIGYLQGDLKVDYTIALLNTTPSLLLSPVASVGATSFYYIKKTGSENGAPLANWDLLWLGMARLIVPL